MHCFHLAEMIVQMLPGRGRGWVDLWKTHNIKILICDKVIQKLAELLFLQNFYSDKFFWFKEEFIYQVQQRQVSK